LDLRKKFNLSTNEEDCSFNGDMIIRAVGDMRKCLVKDLLIMYVRS